MLRMKLPIASRSSCSRISPISRNSSSVSRARSARGGGGKPRLERAQVTDELVRRGIAAVLLRARERAVEPAQHAGHELAEHLAAVPLRDERAVPRALELSRQRRAEVGRDRRGAFRDAEPPEQIAEPLPVPAQAGEAVVVQG